jgi:hypothetical protein
MRGLLSFGLLAGRQLPDMARHRGPPLTVVPPPELLIFDPDEWPAEQWWQSADEWGRARMAFVKQHPGSELGSRLDVLRVQHRLFEERRRSEWEARGAAS